MKIDGLNFTTLTEINDILKMNTTDHANYFAAKMANDIKIIGKEHDVYYYDPDVKLWLCETKEVYSTVMADFLNDTGKNLMRCYKKISEEMDDEEQNQKYIAKIKALQTKFDTRATINDIIDRSTGKLQDNKFVTKLNQVHNCFPVKGGKKINMETLELTDRVKEDYFSFECPVDYVKKTPQADKFFKQVMPGKRNREYLRKVLGYSLTGDMGGRCYFIWYGKGANGKSVIMSIMSKFMKDFYLQCGKGIFMKSSNERVDGPSPDKVALIGVRNAAYSEGETADDIDINESFMKMISGKDQISCRQIYKAQIVFIPICKMHLLTNFVPGLEGDQSTRDRVRYIFLDSRFVDVPDENNKNEFLRDEEFIDSLGNEYLSEMFSWIVRGAVEYYKTGTITPTEEFKLRTEELFNKDESITSFFNNRLIITNDNKHSIRKGILFDTYKQYSTDNSQRCKPRSTFFKRLDDLNIEMGKKDGYDTYKGIQIVGGVATEEVKKETYFEPKVKDDPYDEGVETKELGVKMSLAEKIASLHNTLADLQKQQDNECDEKPKKKPKDSKILKGVINDVVQAFDML